MTDQQEQRGIWWLASYPKSGNTWARMVINAAISGFPPDLNSGFQWVTGDHGRELYGHTAAIPIEEMNERDILSYRLAALRNAMAIFPHRDMCLKTHHGCLTVQDVPLIPAWLTKGAVYVVRDPRDVCISFAKHIGQTVDEAIDFMAHENATCTMPNKRMYHILGDWSTHVTSWLDEDNPLPVMVVRYEDMKDHPQKAFRKMLDGLGLKDRISDEHLNTAIERCRIEKLRSQEDTRGFREASRHTERFFGNGRAGGWKEELTDEQVQRIESTHGEAMQQLGYQLSLLEV